MRSIVYRCDIRQSAMYSYYNLPGFVIRTQNGAIQLMLQFQQCYQDISFVSNNGTFSSLVMHFMNIDSRLLKVLFRKNIKFLNRSNLNFYKSQCNCYATIRRYFSKSRITSFHYDIWNKVRQGYSDRELASCPIINI